jgi:hypothetical protein
VGTGWSATRGRRSGEHSHIYYVRDDEDAQWWSRVEYVRRRLVCWCDDGMARQADEYEPECRHLVAVLAWRTLSQGGPRPWDAINPSTFVD